MTMQERDGAYNEYVDESALKYSHVPAASRFSILFKVLKIIFSKFLK
jgi:hypothetical protein